MKRNLLKAIGISFLIFVLLSWFIPIGTYYGGELKTDGIDAVGIFDLFSIPVSTFLVFILYTITFAVIGGFYGVMEKTGALDKIVQKLSTKFTGKEKRLLVITVIFYAVLSSVTGLVVPLFVLVPLTAMVLLKLNINKVVALASTVGAMLVGSAASTLGFNISGYTKNLLSIDMTNQIIAKVVLLVILTAALILFILKFSGKSKEAKKAEKTKPVLAEEKKVVKKETKETVKKQAAKKETTKKQEPKKTAKKSTTKTTKKPAKKQTKKSTAAMAIAKPTKKVKVAKGVSAVPLVVILVLLMLVSFVGMYNWYYAFEINIFNDIYDSVMGVKIGDFAIFENLLSGISQMGYWGNTELCILLIIASILIAWIYRLSLNDYVESFIKGVKKMLPTAIYAGLASVILYVLYQALSNGTGTLTTTIFAWFLENIDGFNVVVTAIVSLIGSFFYNDLYYLLASISPFVTGFDAAELSIAGLLIQSVYAVGMLIFPTSVLLIAGLSMFDVTFKQWFKYIWKFALVIFLIIVLACCILTLL